MHGHTWKIEIFLGQETLNDLGMVEDFAILKKKFRAFLEAIDHKCLNDLPYFQSVNPTAENLAKYIYDGFQKEVDPLNLLRVRVWESDVASAIYFES